MRKLAAAIALVFTLALPSFALAQLNANSSGLTETGNQAYGNPPANDLSIGTFIGAYIIKPVIGLTGLIFLVLTVYAGMLWMTSSGNEKQVSKAKSILVASVTGAVIVVSAYALTSTVINSLSGTTTSEQNAVPTTPPAPAP